MNQSVNHHLGLLWSKQFYHYIVQAWMDGDPDAPKPSPARLEGRNKEWRHLFNRDIISMPDKWEYPWVCFGIQCNLYIQYMFGSFSICLEASVYVWKLQYMFGSFSICLETSVHVWKLQYMFGSFSICLEASVYVWKL